MVSKCFPSAIMCRYVAENQTAEDWTSSFTSDVYFDCYLNLILLFKFIL